MSKVLNQQNSNPQNPQTPSKGNGISSSDPVAAIFTAADSKLSSDAAAASSAGDLEAAPAADREAGDGFLLSSANQFVGGAVTITKTYAGWCSPAVPAPDDPATGEKRFLLSEEEWTAGVSSAGVAVLKKRFPAVSASSEETALALYLVPWILVNLIPSIVKAFGGLRRGKAPAPTGDSDTRGDGNGQDVSPKASFEPVPTGFPL